MLLHFIRDSVGAGHSGLIWSTSLHTVIVSRLLSITAFTPQLSPFASLSLKSFSFHLYMIFWGGGGGDSFSALYAIRRWGYFLPEVTVTWGFLEGAIERGARMKKLIRSSSELNLSPFSCSSKASDKGLQCEHIRVVTSTTSSPPPHCSEERVQSRQEAETVSCWFYLYISIDLISNLNVSSSLDKSIFGHPRSAAASVFSAHSQTMRGRWALHRCEWQKAVLCNHNFSQR